MRHLLEVDDLVSGYGKARVVQGVSLELEAGRVLTLLGRNGMGKTTLLHAVMGFLPVWGGCVLIDGKNHAGRSPEAISRAGVAIVPQGRRVFAGLTVQENLAVVPSRRRGPWTIPKVFEMFPRLADRRMQLARSMSGGEQQMLAIGRALLTNPAVLLLDEPFEGLAPTIVQDVCGTLRDLTDDGMSLLLVEQNLQIGTAMADEVRVLEKGQLRFSASAHEVPTRMQELEGLVGIS